MKKQLEKTHVMRILDQAGVPYRSYSYVDSGVVSGLAVAEVLGQDPDQVFKTLVTVGHSGEHYVFTIPVSCELDLKKAAEAVGEKSIHMIKSEELLPLTGYVHGGCSPIGMKKQFVTVVDETATLYDAICFSAGRIGYQVQMSVEDLGRIVPIRFADITCM